MEPQARALAGRMAMNGADADRQGGVPLLIDAWRGMDGCDSSLAAWYVSCVLFHPVCPICTWLAREGRLVLIVS